MFAAKGDLYIIIRRAVFSILCLFVFTKLYKCPNYLDGFTVAPNVQMQKCHFVIRAADDE